ncbi:MAG: hypothetical protein WA418_26595 [Bradyrhizobium sp.]
MAIVINDFTAVAEAPPTQPAAAQDGKEADQKGAQAPAPYDIAPVLHLLAYRALRVWAH